ncbi:MAG: hypothetical protein V1809_08795 [Planctomycetota bacterium]
MKDIRGDGGFSLHEVLIGIMVLSVGLVGILAVFPAAIRNASQAYDRCVAGPLANDIVARLSEAERKAPGTLALGYTTPIVTMDTKTGRIYRAQGFVVEDLGGLYKVQVVVDLGGMSVGKFHLYLASPR